MKRVINPVLAITAVLFSSLVNAQAAVVLYNERVVAVDQTLPDATELWVKPDDL
ncbi:MAG: redoxin domain-containing (seleno)protein, partial [Pseudohongiellaceae bacterium]